MGPGDVVRVKTTKREGIVASVDGDDVLVLISEGGHEPRPRWMKADEVTQPAGGENVAPKDVKHWFYR